LRQRRTGVGWKSLQSIPAPAEVPSLTVGEVDEIFAYVASLGGAGSTAARAAAVQALLARATANEQDLLRGLIFGELRQGAMEAAVQEGLAAAFDVAVAAVRRAAMLMSSTTAAAAVLLTGGLEALHAVGLQVESAFNQCLRLRSGSRCRPRADGVPALVDYKLDGVRVQVHRSGDEIRILPAA
jgi:DNA ligase-1